jgi:hypothetical protein
MAMAVLHDQLKLEAHYARLNRLGQCKRHSARPKLISLIIHYLACTYPVQHPDFQHSFGAAIAATSRRQTPRQTAIPDSASLRRATH